MNRSGLPTGRLPRVTSLVSAVAVAAVLGTVVTAAPSAAVAAASTVVTVASATSLTTLSAIPTSSRVIRSDYFGINAYGVAPSRRFAAGVNATPTLSTSTFGTVRLWDSPTILSTRWCDVQPTASANIEANLRARLDPKLDAAARANASRVVIVVGHAAPWVFTQTRSPSTSATATVPQPAAPWFCGGQQSAIAMPSTSYLGTAAAPGPAWKAWSHYVGALVNHINAKYQGKVPFEVALQSVNEPNGLLNVTGRVPNSATTKAEAAASTATYDAIIRWNLTTTPGLDRAHFKLFTAPLTSPVGLFSTRYLALAQAAQMKSHRYDGFSLQTYSKQSAVPLSARQLVTLYNTGKIQAFTRVLPRYPALDALPRHQTETNHGLTLSATATTQPLRLSPADQNMMLSRLIIDGLRWNLASQSLYTINPSLQFPINLRTQTDGTLEVDPTLVRSLAVMQRWLIGSSFEGCVVRSGIVSCTVRNTISGRANRIMYVDDGSTRLIPVQLSNHTAEHVSGAVQQLTLGSTILLDGTPRLIS